MKIYWRCAGNFAGHLVSASKPVSSCERVIAEIKQQEIFRIGGAGHPEGTEPETIFADLDHLKGKS